MVEGEMDYKCSMHYIMRWFRGTEFYDYSLEGA